MTIPTRNQKYCIPFDRLTLFSVFRCLAAPLPYPCPALPVPHRHHVEAKPARNGHDLLVPARIRTLDFALDPTEGKVWTASFTVGDADDDPDPEVYVCDSRRKSSFVKQGTLESTLPRDRELWKPNAQDSGAFLNTLLHLPRDPNPLLVPVPAPREARQREGDSSEHAQGGAGFNVERR
ncbi:hypothetical protein MVLG_06515 [Microbotryum lychnidis-dioicae p1A1 Lamole]|uniref:Uncharacterized protein n=1 Tax=Microbotryum lychnidis-dioicae (strain p1A1 Lamole / MvSl-1064) TaxID=683840 RepID=U5HHI4_USTV1|nr:hypothetical protein MVLG_06515 [Microbotryum lychnidis-dioicae p1A1 Lamole]|eukprot:KDE02981.1 hypothetical protein MVLG_06515 [Microbotryum lychnidis-dioicae p1A1 Lamole]